MHRVRDFQAAVVKPGSIADYSPLSGESLSFRGPSVSNVRGTRWQVTVASATRLSPTYALPSMRTAVIRHDFHFDLDAQLVAGHDRTSETRPLDPREHHQLLIAVFHFGQQQAPPACAIASTIRTPGMIGRFGKMPLKERLVDRDILDRDDPLASGSGQ